MGTTLSLFSLRDLYDVWEAKQERIEKEKVILQNVLMQLNRLMLRKGEICSKCDINEFITTFQALHIELYDCFLQLMPFWATSGCVNSYIIQVREEFAKMQELSTILYSRVVEYETKYDIMNELCMEIFRITEILQKKAGGTYQELISK